MQAELSVAYLEYLANKYLVPFGINLIIALLVFFIGRWVARTIVKWIGRLGARAKFDDSLLKFLQDLAYGLLMTIVVIAALERLGIKTTAAIAVLGAMGLAVGLAMQGSLGNFASGVMIIVFKPYKVGDVVTVGGETGRVDEIKVFNTVLVTADNRQIMIPNGQITAGKIENLNVRGNRRIDLEIGIGYEDDIRLARETLEQIIAAESRILTDPAPTIAVASLGDNSVNLVVRPWVAASDYWPVRFALIETIKTTFDDKGISFPFPQRDVHLYQQQNAA